MSPCEYGRNVQGHRDKCHEGDREMLHRDLRGYKISNTRSLREYPRRDTEICGRESYDMIIMGTHSRKGLDRVFFGSTAERVVRNAKCPVLTVGPPVLRKAAESEKK